MKKVKLSLTILSLFMIFGCQIGNQDEMPELVNPESEVSNEEDMDDPDAPDFMINISLEFTSGFDRASFRNTHGSLFGLESFNTCSSNSNLEIWTIPYMTEPAIIDIIESIAASDPYYSYVLDPTGRPGSASPGLRKTAGDPFANGEEYLFFSVYNICN